MSLGLNNDSELASYLPEPQHKSAGLAFLLSLIIPGAGQLYCGKNGRGGMTLAFWLLGVLFCIARPSDAVLGQAVLVMLVLWIFSFLDAYYTAGEINRGQDDLLEGQNPRVAVTLNLLTAGFGYFYLGEQGKGIALFVVMQVARFAAPARGFWGVSIGLVLVIVQLLVAVDAYRIARRRVKAALESQPPLAAVPSRLPVQVPIVLACLIPIGFFAVVVLGLMFHSLSVSKDRTARAKPRAPSAPLVIKTHNDNPVEVVDLPTAVQDVQRVQRKTSDRKQEVANLQRDVRFLSAALGNRKIDASDAMVAHYFRALAIALLNSVHEQEGEPVDVLSARTARADLDKILHAGTLSTYAPEVNKANAAYLAGAVARNELHDEAAAYGYWQQCAANAHAGCLNNLAGAMITGEGGVKVDALEALKLHTSVFETGVKYHCAGAFSAMNIAEINYFMGVRRADDDELVWSKKADALLDQLEAGGEGKSACSRDTIEIDEFLLRLSKGERDDNILQDAMSRADEDAVGTKAVVQFISGAIDENGFNAAMSASKDPRARCWSYFDAMWYSELRGEGAVAKRFHDQLVRVGTLYCAQDLVFANKYKF